MSSRCLLVDADTSESLWDLPANLKVPLEHSAESNREDSLKALENVPYSGLFTPGRSDSGRDSRGSGAEEEEYSVDYDTYSNVNSPNRSADSNKSPHHSSNNEYHRRGNESLEENEGISDKEAESSTRRSMKSNKSRGSRGSRGSNKSRESGGSGEGGGSRDLRIKTSSDSGSEYSGSDDSDSSSDDGKNKKKAPNNRSKNDIFNDIKSRHKQDNDPKNLNRQKDLTDSKNAENNQQINDDDSDKYSNYEYDPEGMKSVNGESVKRGESVNSDSVKISESANSGGFSPIPEGSERGTPLLRTKKSSQLLVKRGGGELSDRGGWGRKVDKVDKSPERGVKSPDEGGKIAEVGEERAGGKGGRDEKEAVGVTEGGVERVKSTDWGAYKVRGSSEFNSFYFLYFRYFCTFTVCSFHSRHLFLPFRPSPSSLSLTVASYSPSSDISPQLPCPLVIGGSQDP